MAARHILRGTADGLRDICRARRTLQTR
ncbi:MAG: hypothetical protein JWP07_901, partial [Pseudonocardiales bacterium]|nr:hypothetical protein [Pseudonocardiales bacterium]